MKITKETSEQDILNVGKDCNKCGKCCSYGSGFLLESEIPRIANFLKIPTKKFQEEFLEESEIFHTKVFKIKAYKKQDKPFGPCILLDNKICRIHQVKPLHCKIGNCKTGEEVEGDDLHTWFILNYCLNIYDPESIRQYASYIKTGGKILPGAELEKLFPDKHKLKMILDYERFR